MNGLRKVAVLTVIFFATLWVSACNLSNKSSLDVSQIRVREQYVTRAFDLYKFNNNTAKMVANDAMKHNLGDVVLNVSYLKGNQDNKALMLMEGKSIRNRIEKNGVPSVRLELVPVESDNNIGKLIVYYKTRVALPPKDCTTILGSNGALGLHDANNKEYKVGCNSKMVFSKMIADPNDLLGNESYGEVSSRRAGATVEDFKSGEPNEKIEGLNASDMAE